MNKKIKQKDLVPLEYDDQKAIFDWASLIESKYPELELLHGSLNGVRLTIGQSVKAKKAGMKKGFLDISLPVKNKTYSGLYIELKREIGGIVSNDQKKWIKLLQKYGNFACVCKGREAAKEIILKYIENKL